jgi:hypothetical protein
MTDNPILFLPATKAFDDNVKGADVRSWYHYRQMRDLFQSNIVIVIGKTHFCCIKNRWGTTSTRDRIPNHMLNGYLKQFSKHLTKESLIDALVEQHRDRWSEAWRSIDDML